MEKLVLIGGGGHCKSVIDTIKRLNLYDEIVIVDVKFPTYRMVLDFDVVCGDDGLPQLRKSGFDKAFITAGSIKDTSLRQELYWKAHNLGFIFPNIIDPSAIVSEYVTLGKGIFIGKQAIINADVHIGDMAIINTGAVIEHECKINTYVHIAAGAVLCGNVSVGNSSFVGAGSTIIQGVSIGKNSIIGAGSNVLCDVKDDQIVRGLIK